MNPPQPLHYITSDIISSIAQPSFQRTSLGQSTFDVCELGVITCGAAVLCLANYLFLRSQPLIRNQLKEEQWFYLGKGKQGRKQIATFKYKAWLDICFNLLLKVGLPVFLYLLESARPTGTIIFGIVIASALFLYNTFLVFRTIFGPRSIFKRKTAFYRISPNFFRIRIIFEQLRRFLYFIVACTFITYGLNRLDPQSYSAPMPQISLLAQHVAMNLHGATHLGVDPLGAVSQPAFIFDVIRSSWTLILFGLFMVVFEAGFAHDQERADKKGLTRRRIRLDTSIPDYPTKSQVRSIVLFSLKTVLKNLPEPILGGMDITGDLGANSLDLVKLKSIFQEYYELPDIPIEEFQKLRTVDALAEYCFSILQTQRNEKDVQKTHLWKQSVLF